MIEKYFSYLVLAWISIALLLIPILFKVRAPYGRHTSKKWGILIDNRVGWIVMELPSLLLFATLFLSGNSERSVALWVFFSLWVIHYTNRIFIFPLRTRTSGKKIPLLIVAFAMLFNLVNGFLNGFWLGHMSGSLYFKWLSDPRFLIGIGTFIAGFIINQFSDNALIKLRKGNRTGYFIPRGRLFNYISCPNFLGEIIEWTGFAIMTWSLPGLSFAIWTAVNLIPRAIHHHNWYKETFNDYPTERKAVIPGIL